MTSKVAPTVDFERLNDGAIRFAAQAVDLASGADAIFDTRDRTIAPDHIRASGAMPPAFPPVAIDGTLHVDGGLSANLPLDAALGAGGDAPMLCIAVDLLPLAGSPPDTLGTMMERAQDLMFAIQSRRSIARWQERFATDSDYRERSVTLVHLTYGDQQPEVAGKSMDFSTRSVRRRWDAGHRDGEELIARLRAGAVPLRGRGLCVVRMPDRPVGPARHA